MKVFRVNLTFSNDDWEILRNDDQDSCDSYKISSNLSEKMNFCNEKFGMYFCRKTFIKFCDIL